ncbi:hypothetical protein ACEUE7_06175 [Micrococcus endophyticus]|uniref:hypothetical protein n=1 Tax=Micrococcus endophyticus TaxID=455343 RepID=UPI0035A883C6
MNEMPEDFTSEDAADSLDEVRNSDIHSGAEVEVIHDGEGIAVFGSTSSVERFLKSVGLLSVAQELSLTRLASALDTVGILTQAAAGVSDQAGRYVRLTRESAENVKRFGLMPTKTEGISHAMLGSPGDIAKWLQIEDGPVSLLTNPAVLSGVAGVMTQLARQQEAQELKQLLVTIDKKLDDVRRRQRDDTLAELDRVSFVINEALTIRDHGGDRETAWQKVLAEGGVLAEVQADALRALQALADKAAGEANPRPLVQVTRQIEGEVGVWLAVLARCFELQNEYAVLELDHVFDTAPAALDGHRTGLDTALRERRDKIIEKTGKLMDRLSLAGDIARENVVLHARASRAIVNSINSVGDTVDNFHTPFSVDARGHALTSVRWRDAIRDREQLRNAAAEAGPKVLVGAAAAGTVALGIVKSVIDSKSSDLKA